MATSQQNRFSNISSCRQSDYDNLVVLKNFADEGLWVRMEIAFYNRRQEVMEVLQLGPVFLEAEEVMSIVSANDRENASVWDHWTNDTEDKTVSIKYRYQYRTD